VRESTMLEYTGIKTVVAVGGTWIAPAADIAAGNWASITAKATAACGLLV
jgi:2-dehydro-3-deoxyphosphogluconate aldolase/(4S)-4-hydroxy-2-oxoglutarate aldolase